MSNYLSAQIASRAKHALGGAEVPAHCQYQLETKEITMRLVVFLMLSCLSICALAQSAPPDSWTKEELDWVTRMRQTYAEQELGFTDEQASAAVAEIRQKRHPAGVPESAWTDNERTVISSLRAQMKSQGQDLSDEQARLTVMKLRNMTTNPIANAAALPAPSNATQTRIPAPTTLQPQLPSGTLSEQTMAERINAIQGTDVLRFTGARDGFSVNERRFVDPEGRVIMHAHNVVTRNIGYIVRRSDDFAIKMLPKGDVSSEPVLVATATWDRGRWTVNTTTGKTISGQSVSVAPDGVIVGRGSATFVYQAGIGLQSVSIPDGYEVARMQRGDVSGTGYLLIERIDAKGGDSVTGKAASSFKSLGALVGIGKKEDYALMEIQSGRLIPLNIDANGKDVHELSGCVPMNGLVNKCSSMHSFESLYTDTGKNNLHYYWRAAWFPTPTGPVAVSLENGVKELFVTDLTSGKRVTAFRRALGINGYDVEQSSEGVISINARLGFSDQQIADVSALLRGDATGMVEK